MFSETEFEQDFNGFYKKIVDICGYLLYILYYYIKALICRFRQITASAERGCIIEKKRYY